MSSDSQRKPKKMLARGNSSKGPTGQRKLQTDPPGAKATASAAKALPQHHARKSAVRPSNTPTTASPNNSHSATAPPPRQNHVPPTHKIRRPETNDTLVKELQEYYPGVHWFDSYDSLDRKLLNAYSKNPDIKNTRLANLEIPVGKKNGTQHKVGLQQAVRDTISYLLDVEAGWNPVTLITPMPAGVSKPLWDRPGKLYLGGIKDSGNVEGVLKELKIDAVVSIHPTDWLTDECWKDLFHKWDGDLGSLRLKNSKPVQYHIELHDDSKSDLLGYFEMAFRFMDEVLIVQRKNVLVHCKMGQSRSASLVLGYMMYRYYKIYFANLDPKKRPPTEKILAQLQGALGMFLGELTRKRKGVSTKKFKYQLEQYARYLAEDKGNQPPEPSKPLESNPGGGIIKDAAMVLCFMCNIDPTLEVLRYWKNREQDGKNTHYWIAASQDKALRQGSHVEDHLGAFNQFFEKYWTNVHPCVAENPPCRKK